MENKTYQILHLMTGFGGGISAFILNKAEELRGTNLVFNVVTFDETSDRFKQAIANTGGKIYKISDPEKTSYMQMIKDYRAVLKKFDKKVIIHSHFGMNLVVPFYFISKLRGIKRFIVHAHTGAPYRLNDKKRKANRFFAQEKVSAGVKCSENTFGEVSTKEDNIMHIPNSIDPEKYLSPVTDQELVKLKEKYFGEEHLNKKIFGHVGRFHHVKNHKFMVEIINELSKEYTNFLWVFIGSGDLREEIEKELKARNLMQFVKFLGWQNDPSKFFKLFDVTILPSFYEGLPTVAIESQAAGIPILLSDTITREVDLGLGLTKFLQLEDKHEWVNKLVNHEFQSHSIDKREKVIIEKKFTNEASAQLYKDFIEGKIQSYNI